MNAIRNYACKHLLTVSGGPDAADIVHLPKFNNNMSVEMICCSLSN